MHDELTPQQTRILGIVREGIDKAIAAEREACAAICDAQAAVNREAAEERGHALGREKAAKDERCAALWASFHEAKEIAAAIRARQ